MQASIIEELPMVHEYLNHEPIAQDLDDNDNEGNTKLRAQQRQKGNKGAFNGINASYQSQSSSQVFPSQSSKAIYRGQNKSVCGWKYSHTQMIDTGSIASSKLALLGALSITNDQDKPHQVTYVKPRKEKYDFG